MLSSDIGIVFCPNVQWDSAWERFHQFAHLFGAERKTLFVNNAGLEPFNLSQSLENVMARVRQANSQNPLHPSEASAKPGNLTSCTPILLPAASDPHSTKLNAQFFSKQVLATMQKAGMNRAILWAGSPTANVVHLATARDWDLVIYDCIADHAEIYPFQLKQILAAEAALIKRADIVLTSSHLLEQKIQRYNPSNVRRLPNGLDLGRFSQQTKMPLGLGALRHPIIGYLGDMRDKIFDITLVTNLAKFHPEWSVVLVGPITRSLVTKIDEAPVRLIGPVSYDEAPAYLRAFDVAINPLVQSVVTRSMNPLRIYEYLACGLPVVSSPIPDLDIFGDLVIQVSGADRFSFAVHATMQEGKQRAAQRQLAAMQFTWDRLFTQVKALLESSVKV